jgi:zinc transport system substrate-binding protein
MGTNGWTGTIDAALLGAALLLTTGCGSGIAASSTDAPPGTSSVVAAFYPLAFAAEQVGGDHVQVTSLTPPGVEPHDLELSAAQVAQIAAADVVLYIRGFQPAVDEAIDQQAADRAIDVSAGLEHLPADPHVWLDPQNMAAIGRAVAERISQVDPSAATDVAANSAALTSTMTVLDEQFAAGLAHCASRDLVVSHEAFGYLADAYDLTQIGISGLAPEAEPSPARIREVVDLVRANGIATVYYEPLVDPKVAQTVADETGTHVAALDPLEGLVADGHGDYVSVMTDNLATLVAGQRCS